MIPFYVGQKVTMKPTPPGWNWALWKGEIGPKFGHVYTIRSIFLNGLRFVEIINPPIDTKEGFHECTFFPSRFRPALERPTDISFFERLLNPTPEELDQFNLDETVRYLMMEGGLLTPPGPPKGGKS